VPPHTPAFLRWVSYPMRRWPTAPSQMSFAPDTPVLATILLEQRLRHTGGVDLVSCRPDIVGRNGCHSQQVVAYRPCPGAQALDHAPAGAVPVLGQRLEVGNGRIQGVSHGPDVAG